MRAARACTALVLARSRSSRASSASGERPASSVAFERKFIASVGRGPKDPAEDGLGTGHVESRVYGQQTPKPARVGVHRPREIGIANGVVGKDFGENLPLRDASFVQVLRGGNGLENRVAARVERRWNMRRAGAERNIKLGGMCEGAVQARADEGRKGSRAGQSAARNENRIEFRHYSNRRRKSSNSRRSCASSSSSAVILSRTPRASAAGV